MTSSEAIRTCRLFLEERMDPDFGLLDTLLADGTIDSKEMDEVKNSKSSLLKRNSQLLDYILAKDQGGGLKAALRDADQIHIVNYLTANGEYSDGFGEDWPLTAEKISLLQTNHGSLVDLLELTGLLGLLYFSKVINNCQRDSIYSKPTSQEMNDALLDILRRRSLRDYQETITCLRQSQQSHIAEILDDGGVVVRARVNLDGENVTEIETEIATKIANIIISDLRISIDQPSRILGPVPKIIAAKTGQSIVLYIYCKTIEELQQLHESAGQVKDSVELWFNRLLNESQKITVTALTVSTGELQKNRICLKVSSSHSSLSANRSLCENPLLRRRNQSKQTRHSDDTGEAETSVTEEEEASGQSKKTRHSGGTGETETSVTDYLRLRAIRDFDPKQMTSRERFDLDKVLNKGLHQGVESSEYGEFDDIEIDVETYDTAGCKEVEEFGITMMDSQSNIEEQVMKLEHKKHSIGKEEAPSSRETSDSEEELTKKSSVDEKQDSELQQGDQQTTSDDSDDGVDPSAVELEQEGGRTKPRKRKNSDQGPYVVQYAYALSFQKRDKMETISSANVGDSVGWWNVRHMDSGKIGFIPRNRVVIEHYQQPSKTTLNQLPLEMLDIILENSFLFWILTSAQHQRDDAAIRALASVDFCWFQRVTGQKFKKRIWKRQKVFYVNNNRRSAIIRNNRKYLLENIQQNDELFALLLFFDCITDEQSYIIQRQRSNRDKNAELLNFLRSFDQTKYSNFVRCLRRNNQKTVARIVENGGVVIKVDVQNLDENMYTQQIHQKIEDLRERTKPKSHQSDKLVSQLKDDGIEILCSQLDKRTVVVWIWCHSQAAFDNIQRIFESNQLTGVLLGLANIRSSTSEIIQSKAISINSNELKKTVVVCPMSVNFTQRINVKRNEVVLGVTKLRNEIYVLCPSSLFPYTNIIRVFEDRKPFHNKKKIKLKEIQSPWDIKASEKENCLYVSESGEEELEDIVWKITREIDGQVIIIKWMMIQDRPLTLSVSNDGQLMMVSNSSSRLLIYGSDTELLRSIQLPGDIRNPRHAVETSMGNFIIIHWWLKEEDEGERVLSVEEKQKNWGVCEVSRDGQTVIRRFIPSNLTQNLNDPWYLSLDSDDRVFVADTINDRVILFDPTLKWNRILCPIKEEETMIRNLNRLCYDEEKEQLFVVGRELFSKEGVNVYTFCRK